MYSIETHLLDLTRELWTGKGFDLIFTSMTLHHIAHEKNLLSRFKEMLNTDGYLAIADLDVEDGSFHGKDKQVPHHGFDRGALTTTLQRIGFGQINCHTVHHVTKRNDLGKETVFPMFFLTAKKYVSI